jgi:hypothetical protein
MRRITPQQLMNGKRRKKKQKRDMDPVNLKKAMFGLGGYRHNHPPSISLGNNFVHCNQNNLLFKEHTCVVLLPNS